VFQLLQDYQGQDVKGFFMSEKFDGNRTIFDGRSFWSREGNRWLAPEWFLAGLPDVVLDGEIHLGRGGFNGIRRAMRDGWHGLTFSVFDAPKAGGSFRSRLKFLGGLSLPDHVAIVPQIRCRDTQHLVEFADAIVDAGGEGAVVRNPLALYRAGRSGDVLRYVPQDPALNRRRVA
jgi:DNA ligase 1